MMISVPEMQKPVWLSEDSLQMSGSEMESSLTLSCKSTRLWYCKPSFTLARHGQNTNVMQRDIIIFLAVKKSKVQDKISDRS